MIGLICCDGAPDARFFCVRVRCPGGARAYLSARRAAAVLARAGVRHAVFPREYPYVPVFARRGVVPVPVLPLRTALAAEIVRRCLETAGLDPRRTAVACAAGTVSRDFGEAVLLLSGSVRYLALAAQEGGEALARRLLRSRGVAVCRPESASLWVAFDAAAPAPDGALKLWDRSLSVDYTLSGEPIGEPTLAALWRMGAVRRDQIAVTGVSEGAGEASGLKRDALQKVMPSSSR